MTAFAVLTLNDNAAAAQTFNPASIDSSSVAKWLGTEALLDAKKSVTMSVSLPKSTGSVVRVRQRVAIPIMDSVVTNKKIGESYADITIVIPKFASSTDRLNLRAFTQNLLANAVSTAAITNFESIY